MGDRNEPIVNRQASLATTAVSWALRWHEALGESALPGQRWVLSVMQGNGQALVTMLWRILGNESDVCDAYQDTFLRLVNCRAGRKPDNAKAFAFRTASNVAISMLRRRKAHLKACRAVAERRPKHAECDPAGELDAPRLQALLRTSLAQLPERMQSVIILKDLADLGYSEVARILNISTASARVYRCRGVQLLAARMKRLDGAE